MDKDSRRAERRLYNAAIKDRAFTYAWFFLMFAAHIIFCIWSAVSPPLPLGNAWSHTGFILGVQARALRKAASRRPEWQVSCFTCKFCAHAT
jgi:hypothetical protein